MFRLRDQDAQARGPDGGLDGLGCAFRASRHHQSEALAIASTARHRESKLRVTSAFRRAPTVTPLAPGTVRGANKSGGSE
jgi:hypothetical protein